VYKPRNWINCGQAGPLGWTVPAALGVATADPSATVVGLSGDYDFEFLIEELAVGAQFNLPYVHVVVNNSYLGLIRQAQRGFDMNYHVSLGFDNINAQETDSDVPKGYGVDHLRVVEGLGCKAIQVVDPDDIGPASRSSWRRSPTSRWAPRSTTSSSSTISPNHSRTRQPPPHCFSTDGRSGS
jgi:tartronate-semialdehyde synthase